VIGSRSKKSKRDKRRQRKCHPPESMVAIIDRLLVEPVSATVNGETKKMCALEAIVFQLFQKALAGNAHAHRTFLKYQEFASQNSEKKLELTFIENNYTSALSNELSAGDA
jgi:Family of unknown function (DUF5681)